MAACGSLQHIFEKPLPESPLFDSLSSWKQITSMKPIDASSFAELFGELHFKENDNDDNNRVDESSFSSSLSQSQLSPLPLSSQSSNLSSLSSFSDANQQAENEKIKNEKKGVGESYYPTTPKEQYKHSDSFSSMNSESLSLCTEGLGFESSDDVEDLMNEISLDWKQREDRRYSVRNRRSEYSYSESKRLRNIRGGSIFPPPISCIGRNGKPWVCFKSFRQDGRFILKEVRIPTQECLHACRENGRLKLQLIQSDDENFDDDDDEDEDEDEEDEDDDLENVEEENEGKGEEDVVVVNDEE